MQQVQLATLAWRYRRELGISAVVVGLLFLTGIAMVGSIFGMPLASDLQQQYYIQAVTELKEQKDLVLDFRQPLAVDAVRLNQDFSAVTLQRARDTVALFVEQASGKYQLKPLEKVLVNLNMAPEHVAIAVTMAGGDGTGTFCFGFVPRRDGPYLWPVDGIITSCFGPRLDPVEGVEAYHWGIDLAAPEGTPVLAAHDGQVNLAHESGNYGNLVILIGSDGVSSWYGHLSEFSVQRGQHIRKGDVIGLVGSTGKSTGPHLHFEVRVSQGQQPAG